MQTRWTDTYGILCLTLRQWLGLTSIARTSVSVFHRPSATTDHAFLPVNLYFGYNGRQIHNIPNIRFEKFISLFLALAFPS